MNNGRLKTHRLPNCVHHHYRQITSLIRAIIAGSSLADTLQRALFGHSLAPLHRFRLHFDDLARLRRSAVSGCQ